MQPKKHYFAHIPTIAIFIVFAMSAPLGVLLFILKSIDKNAEKEQKKTAFHSIIAEHGLFVKGEILMCVEAAGE